MVYKAGARPASRRHTATPRPSLVSELPAVARLKRALWLLARVGFFQSPPCHKPTGLRFSVLLRVRLVVALTFPSRSPIAKILHSPHTTRVYERPTLPLRFAPLS